MFFALFFFSTFPTRANEFNCNYNDVAMLYLGTIGNEKWTNLGQEAENFDRSEWRKT